MLPDEREITRSLVGAGFGAVTAAAGQRDVARVEPEPADPADPGSGVPQDVGGEIGDLTTLRALRV